MKLQRLSEHVYACEQDRTGTGWANSGLVTAGGGLVVDTFWDLPLTRSLIDLYRSVYPDQPRRIVNTHHNGDHCWGNQLFVGSEIIAHRGCARRFFDVDPGRLQAIRELAHPGEQLQDLHDELLPFDFSGVELTPPTTVVDGDVTLDLDGLAVELLHVGPAHTEGDLIVHVPAEGVVLAGDVLFNQCAPLGWEGSTGQWIAALARIEALGPDYVVPGHGPVCGIEETAAARRYFEDVASAARSAWAEGRSVLQVCTDIDLGPYARWAEPWRLPATVHRVYRECVGAHWDQPFDVTEVMGDVRSFRAYLDGRR